MHPYMIRSFGPFFRPGSLLELGSFKGDFTRRFLPLFDDITCVEASSVAITAAQEKLGDKVKFVHGLFETVMLPRRFDNIVLTHVLEHLDDPVQVLKRINDEWLSLGGRLFLVCPNANAPSRQIAVKMGLISHNSAVTEAEAQHGHRRTYALDTLERDATAAGLQVVHRSGIFFKALAGFNGTNCSRPTSFLQPIWTAVTNWGNSTLICAPAFSCCVSGVTPPDSPLKAGVFGWTCPAMGSATAAPFADSAARPAGNWCETG